MNPEIATLAPRDTERSGLRATELWILSAQLGIVITVVAGFGAYQPVPINALAFMLLSCTGATIALGPPGNWRRLVVTGPVVAVLGWKVASIAWSSNPVAWQRGVREELPLVVALAVFASLLPVRRFLQGLLAGCEIAIAYTVAFTLIRPGVAMTHSYGGAGWTGGFIHKNALAPFMLFAILTIILFERRKGYRVLLCLVASFYIVVSLSTTTLAVGLLLIPLGVLMVRIDALPYRRRATLLIGSVPVALALGLLISLNTSVLLESRGKDATLSTRTVLWPLVISAVEQRPWAGYGFGALFVNLSVEPGRTITKSLGFAVRHAHNGYLELLLQVGAVGLCLFMILVALVFRAGLRLSDGYRDLGVMIVLYVTMILLLSITEVTTGGIWLALLCAFHILAGRARNSVQSVTRPVPASRLRSTPR